MSKPPVGVSGLSAGHPDGCSGSGTKHASGWSIVWAYLADAAPQPGSVTPWLLPSHIRHTYSRPLKWNSANTADQQKNRVLHLGQSTSDIRSAQIKRRISVPGMAFVPALALLKRSVCYSRYSPARPATAETVATSSDGSTGFET